MRKASALLALLVLLSSPVTAAINPITNAMKSVAYLGNGNPPVHCTAFSVKHGEWLTEYHCLDFMPQGLKINGTAVTVIKADKNIDLALLKGPVVTPLPISTREPELGEHVLAIGWAGEWPGERPQVFYGRTQALSVVLGVEPYPAHNMNFFHEGGGPGMSGGPIISEKTGKVVGVQEAGWTFPSVSVGSPTVNIIRTFLGLRVK